MHNRVFILEKPRTIDVSKAKEFGELVYVFKYNDRRCSVFEHETFGNCVLERMRALNFNPDVDFVCVVGSHIPLAVTLVAIAQVYSEFKLLLFSSTRGSYVARRFKQSSWVKETEHEYCNSNANDD